MDVFQVTPPDEPVGTKILRLSILLMEKNMHDLGYMNLVHGINYQTSTGFHAGFLNHQPVRA